MMSWRPRVSQALSCLSLALLASCGYSGNGPSRVPQPHPPINFRVIQLAPPSDSTITGSDVGNKISITVEVTCPDAHFALVTATLFCVDSTGALAGNLTPGGSNPPATNYGRVRVTPGVPQTIAFTRWLSNQMKRGIDDCIPPFATTDALLIAEDCADPDQNLFGTSPTGNVLEVPFVLQVVP